MTDTGNDTIAAIATGPAPGAIGIVRISGPATGAVVDRLFQQRRGFPGWAAVANHTLHYGRLADGGRDLDHILLLVMRAPHSYTGEDVAEFHCHGGTVAPHLILEVLLAQGIRAADPGEFTRRAFMNGRLDLSQAEAVAAVVAARHRQALELATAQQEGRLSAWIGEMRSELEELQTALTYDVDFTEDAEPLDLGPWRVRLERLACELRNVIERSSAFIRVLEGVAVVITGPPNAGKSSLFNAWLGEERAIVTDQAGTTRDPVRASVVCGDMAVQLIDTAGGTDSVAPVEEAAEARRRQAVADAQAVVLLFDGSIAPSAEAEAFSGVAQEANTVTVLNKSDLPTAWTAAARNRFAVAADVSAKTGAGLGALVTLVTEKMALAVSEPEAPGAINARQQSVLLRAEHELRHALEELERAAGAECLLVEIRLLLTTLGEITGETTSAEVIDDIFARFCVGK